MAGDSSDNTANSIDENFSMSELAPRKLFDSKDTIVNIADEILDNSKLAQNSFGTPVILRRGNMDSRWASSQQKNIWPNSLGNQNEIYLIRGVMREDL